MLFVAPWGGGEVPVRSYCRVVDVSERAVIGGRYRLDRMIGQGGMGSVWAATHMITQRAVAMKFLRGSAQARPELRRRLLREARAATAVDHPNVVEVLDVFELDDDTPVLVMDLLSGETLGARIARQGSLSVEDTAGLLLPVVSAVGAAHARGIVHRDLKPDNILLSDDDVKVLDFGVAKLTEGDGSSGSIVTQTGSAVGTPCYMAPEQAAGEGDLDHRVDVWALGVILYECLSGARPIEGESVGQVVMRLMTVGIAPLERIVIGLPEEMTRLVGRMLSREKHLRPQSLHEVYDVLARYTAVRAPSFGEPQSELLSRVDPAPIRTERIVVPADAHGDTVTAKPRGRRLAWTGAAAAMLVATVGIALSKGTPHTASSIQLPSMPKLPSAPAPAPVTRPAPSAAPQTHRASPPNSRPAHPPAAPTAAPSATFEGGLAEDPPF